MKKTWTKDDLIRLKRRHDVLLAIDSDGCVFDSMSVKQRVFRTGTIEFWGLEVCANDVNRICEWVGLYSPWRGLNRFQLILKFFQSLEKYLPNLGTRLPTEPLREFVESGATLSMTELSRWIERTGCAELEAVLEWSREMSRRIEEINVFPVFDGVFQCLEKLHATADLIVVSQTTEDALVREWNHAGITGFVDVIAGAELGSKKESLEIAMAGRYSAQQTLMVGDAFGDLEAARAAGCLFFPILPGEEGSSWAALCSEGLARLQNGTFAGVYQADLIERFNAALSPAPPWLGISCSADGDLEE